MTDGGAGALALVGTLINMPDADTLLFLSVQSLVAAVVIALLALFGKRREMA